MPAAKSLNCRRSLMQIGRPLIHRSKVNLIKSIFNNYILLLHYMGVGWRTKSATEDPVLTPNMLIGPGNPASQDGQMRVPCRGAVIFLFF